MLLKLFARQHLESATETNDLINKLMKPMQCVSRPRLNLIMGM